MNSGDERYRTAGLLLAKQMLPQLSYIPNFRLEFHFQIEFKTKRDYNKWAYLDSNQRPHAYQACALTT